MQSDDTIVGGPRSAELPIHIYTPEPLLKHPFDLLRDMWSGVRDGRDLAWRLFVRDVKAGYRQTYLGYVWAFLPPLASAFTFIFLQTQGIVHVTGTGMPYAAFAMIGTLIWATFVESIASPLDSVGAAKPLLAKINFPREAVLLTGIYKIGLSLLIRMALLVVVLVVAQVTPGIGLLMFPVAMAALFAAGYAVGLVMLPLGSLYNDVRRAISMGAGLWMLLTPVVYPPKSDGILGFLAVWNPISPLMITARESLTGASFTALPAFFSVFAVSSVIVVVGLMVFRIIMPHVIERMGG